MQTGIFYLWRISCPYLSPKLTAGFEPTPVAYQATVLPLKLREQRPGAAGGRPRSTPTSVPAAPSYHRRAGHAYGGIRTPNLPNLNRTALPIGLRRQWGGPRRAQPRFFMSRDRMPAEGFEPTLNPGPKPGASYQLGYTGKSQCARRDSNPHCPAPQTGASYLLGYKRYHTHNTNAGTPPARISSSV